MLLATPRAALLALFAAPFPLVACHAGPSEPAPTIAAPDATPQAASPRQHQAHRIIEQDHRHVVQLRVDDRIVLPVDPAFEWRVAFEDASAFARFTEADSGGEAYRLTKAGPWRLMVYGDPKCLKLDGGCGLSKRRWDVTIDAR